MVNSNIPNMERSDYIKERLVQLIEKGNNDVVDELFSIEYVAHAGDKVYWGHPFLKKYVRQVRRAIPDIKLKKMEVLSQSEDRLTSQRFYTGTHSSSMMGIPASKKRVSWHEMVVTRFEDGKIVEEWIVSDLAFQLIRKLNA